MSRARSRALRVSLRLSTVLATAVLAGAALAGPDHRLPFGEPAKAKQATRTVTITMRDNEFEPDKVTVKAGEIVRFVVVNKGELLHEFSIGTAAMHAEHQAEMAMLMEHGVLTPTSFISDPSKIDHSKMGGMSMDEMKHDHPNSVLVEPGKTAELVWKFSKATELEFACNVPGHYEAGMVGKITFAK